MNETLSSKRIQRYDGTGCTDSYVYEEMAVKEFIQDFKKQLKHNKVSFHKTDSKRDKLCFKTWNDCLKDVEKELNKLAGEKLS